MRYFGTIKILPTPAQLSAKYSLLPAQQETPDLEPWWLPRPGFLPGSPPSSILFPNALGRVASAVATAANPVMKCLEAWESPSFISHLAFRLKGNSIRAVSTPRMGEWVLITASSNSFS